MTLAVAPSPSTSRPSRPVRRGWRATPERPFPTLGWLVLDWTYAFLPSPLDEKKPLVYTDEQARIILEWYRIDPLTGRFVHDRRLRLEEPKGWGKQPFAASIDIVEFAGPACFDGWDAYGQPVGVAWGTGERFDPLVQIGAVSEAQTMNTYSWVYTLLTANNHRAAIDLRIDEGRTRLYLLDNPKAKLEPVTAAALSREGAPVTHATYDEPQLWYESNGGHDLYDNISGNLTKTDGRGVLTGNAYVKGEDSVSERLDVVEPGVLAYAPRPGARPERDWPRERLVEGLAEVYGDAYWMFDKFDRIVDDAVAPSADWDGMVRKFWNLPSDGGGHSWMPRAIWDDTVGVVELRATEPTYAVVTVAHDHRSAAVALAQAHGDQVGLQVRHFAGGDDELVTVADIEAFLLGLKVRFPARVLAPKRFAAGKERVVPQPGPEIVYHGSFFESSAQRLRLQRLAMVDIPDSQERLAPAAETLKGLALEARLVHEDDAALSQSIGQVSAKEIASGWSIQHADAAARAAMVAVHRAVIAPKPAASKPVFHSW